MYVDFFERSRRNPTQLRQIQAGRHVVLSNEKGAT